MTPAKVARQKAGMTVHDVARRASTSPSSVSRIERGKQRALPQTAERLAKVLRISETKVLYPERFAPKKTKK